MAVFTAPAAGTVIVDVVAMASVPSAPAITLTSPEFKVLPRGSVIYIFSRVHFCPEVAVFVAVL
jgi:hypothetical protein